MKLLAMRQIHDLFPYLFKGVGSLYSFKKMSIPLLEPQYLPILLSLTVTQYLNICLLHVHVSFFGYLSWYFIIFSELFTDLSGHQFHRGFGQVQFIVIQGNTPCHGPNEHHRERLSNHFISAWLDLSCERLKAMEIKGSSCAGPPVAWLPKPRPQGTVCAALCDLGQLCLIKLMCLSLTSLS